MSAIEQFLAYNFDGDADFQVSLFVGDYTNSLDNELPCRRASPRSSGMHRLTTTSTLSRGEQKPSITQSAKSVFFLAIGPILS
jgi:hypothetical protein